MATPLMPKATAVWLVDNTALTFDQIAEFCGLHALEVKGIADGEVAIGIKGIDPITSGQLTREELERCQGDTTARLQLMEPKHTIETKRRSGPRYTPVSKRQDRPAAILWLLNRHPELADAQISKLVGTTKPTIESLRSRSHWNISNIQPVDPVQLGLCSQKELDEAVGKATRRKERAAAKAARENRIAASEDQAAELAATPFEDTPIATPVEDTPAGNPDAIADAEALFAPKKDD
ncbi:MAG: DUF1013 domain-containing protein [Alphaproteobacteria bacterium]